nr:radical SAM protein [Pseudodesulfovibrio sp.]
MYKIAEMMLFSTCNYRCGYCNFVLGGDTKKKDDLYQYKDRKYIDSIVSFFNSISTTDVKWIGHMSGGEPLLMPNYNYFVRLMVENGHKVALNTNLSIPIDRNGWLKHNHPDDYSCIIASCHQQSLNNFEKIYSRVKTLKDAGFPIYVRMVGHPLFISHMPDLDEAFRKIDVSFSTNAFYSPNYPKAYTQEEQDTLLRYMRSHNEAIGLGGGLSMEGRVCAAGAKMICLDLSSRGRGRVYPCVSSASEDNCMGDIYSGITLLKGYHSCLRRDNICSCPDHFMHGIVPDMEEPKRLQTQLTSYAPSIYDSWRKWFAERDIITRFHAAAPQGTAFGEKNLQLPSATLLAKQGRMVAFPSYLKWRKYQGVLDVLYSNDACAVKTEKVKFDYLFESPSRFLRSGFYMLSYKVEVGIGGVTVGIQDEKGKKWIASQNHSSSCDGQIVFTLNRWQSAKIVVANYSEMSSHSEFILSSMKLIKLPAYSS